MPAHNFKDLTGKKFGMLVAIERSGTQNRKAVWKCRCDCGSLVDVLGASLLLGRTVRCSKHRGEITAERSRTHGMARHPIYKAFHHAKARCNNPTDKDYSYYGGRGIEFRFTSFDVFLAEVQPGWGPGLTLDRIDVDGHYEQGNLRWVTQAEQNKNQQKAKRRREARE